MSKNIDEICSGIERVADQLIETHDDYVLNELSQHLHEWLSSLNAELKDILKAINAQT